MEHTNYLTNSEEQVALAKLSYFSVGMEIETNRAKLQDIIHQQRHCENTGADQTKLIEDKIELNRRYEVLTAEQERRNNTGLRNFFKSLNQSNNHSN